MKRYVLTLIRFWSTAIAAQLEYKANVVVDLVSIIGSLVGTLFVLSLFFREGSQLGGWSWEEAIIVQGVYTFLSGVSSTFLRPNLTEIIKHIKEGTLDFVILKPLDSQFWLSTRAFEPVAGLPEMFVGILLISWSSIELKINLTFDLLVLSLLMLSSGVIILYSLWFIIATTSIWFVQTQSATEVLRSLLTAGRFPVSSYPNLVRIIFTLIIPVAFLTSVPAEAFLGKISILTIFVSFIVSIMFFYISRKFWTYALKFYTSASS